MNGRANVGAGHSRVAALSVALFSVLVLLTVLEGGFRFTRYLVRGPSFDSMVDDAELGWVHNIRRPTVTRANSCGERVVTLPPPNPYILRYPRSADGTRVLFLGDSSTHAHEVSTGAAYYDVVEAMGRGRYSVWAAGAGGYGSLQEYLLLEKIYDEVRPEIVVWQLDSNDVANNVYRLDRDTILNNVQPRPYLDPASGAIELRAPGLFVLRISLGARFVLSRVVALDRTYNLGMIDTMNRWLGPPPNERPALIRQGLQVLDHVVSEAVRRHPQTRYAGFAADSLEDQGYAGIFSRNGSVYWPNFSDRVRAGAGRTDCAPWDSHWNHIGNRVAGQLLVDLLSGR